MLRNDLAVIAAIFLSKWLCRTRKTRGALSFCTVTDCRWLPLLGIHAVIFLPPPPPFLAKMTGSPGRPRRRPAAPDAGGRAQVQEACCDEGGANCVEGGAVPRTCPVGRGPPPRRAPGPPRPRSGGRRSIDPRCESLYSISMQVLWSIDPPHKILI